MSSMPDLCGVPRRRGTRYSGELRDTNQIAGQRDCILREEIADLGDGVNRLLHITSMSVP
jgi:hypothetical protein